MLSKEKILGLINNLVAEKELFIVSLDISTSNKIKLVVDSMKGVGIDECVQLSRAIEHNLDREEEDFELEVSSAGLSEPFVMKQQYQKNLGKEVEVQLNTGKKYIGKLIAVDESDFSIEFEKRMKIEGKKKKQLIKEILKFEYTESCKVKIVIKF